MLACTHTHTCIRAHPHTHPHPMYTHTIHTHTHITYTHRAAEEVGATVASRLIMIKKKVHFFSAT